MMWDTVKGMILAGEYVPLDELEGETITVRIDADGTISIPAIAAEAVLDDVPRRTDGFYRNWSQAGGLEPRVRPERRFRMSCCDDPKPRILERNGRIFCASCRRYLDKPPVDSAEARAAEEAEEGGGDEVPGDPGAR